jgi:hypothetical protein
VVSIPDVFVDGSRVFYTPEGRSDPDGLITESFRHCAILPGDSVPPLTCRFAAGATTQSSASRNVSTVPSSPVQLLALDAGQKKHKVDPSQVEIGASSLKVSISETDKEFVFNKVVLQKAELSAACGNAPEARCWAVAVSSLGWPLCLRMCPYAGQPGHESHDSSAHCFTLEELHLIQTLYQAAAQLQGRK